MEGSEDSANEDLKETKGHVEKGSKILKSGGLKFWGSKITYDMSNIL